LHLDGVLFMEGEGEPVEITHLKRDLRTFAEDATAAGTWLDTAMQSSWDVAPALLDFDDLADLLGERRRSSPTTGRPLASRASWLAF
jgi:hypothetical protein